MKIIIGLGNPGKKYQRTRHNAGFLAIDNYLQNHQTITCQSKFEAEICELHQSNEAGPTLTKVLFVKPQTFMNESGRAVAEIVNFYKVNLSDDVLVIHDEVDLPLGTIREAYNSSSAGHNGINSLIEQLGTQQFHRLRIGVEVRESRTHLPTEAFVLQDFADDQWQTLQDQVMPEVQKKIDNFINQT